jgi:hypothetical protein
MNISINAEKILKQTQQLFPIKVLKKLEIEGTYLKIIMAVFNKPITKIMLNGEKEKSFPLKSGIKQVCPFSPLLLNVVVEFLAKATRQDKG